jgi:hypothetical protein
MLIKFYKPSQTYTSLTYDKDKMTYNLKLGEIISRFLIKCDFNKSNTTYFNQLFRKNILTYIVPNKCTIKTYFMVDFFFEPMSTWLGQFHR